MSNYVRKIDDAAKLHKDPVHKKIMSTKRKLQEDDDYEAQEAIKYAVKKRKYLIQEATGTLSDDELEDEEEESEKIFISHLTRHETLVLDSDSTLDTYFMMLKWA